MNAGVSMTPWAAVSRPSRAAPLRASTSKRGGMPRIAACGQNQHRISVAEKSIPRAYRMRIRREHPLASGEGAHEHEQRRLRQVEVRDEGLDDAEREARP